MTTWTAHNGKTIPLAAMADQHLAKALAKLRTQETALVRMIAGLDPEVAQAFRKQMATWTPIFTPTEILERTRTWITTLEAERARRETEKWPEI